MVLENGDGGNGGPSLGCWEGMSPGARLAPAKSKERRVA